MVVDVLVELCTLKLPHLNLGKITFALYKNLFRYIFCVLDQIFVLTFQVYKPDQSYKYLPVNKETTAHEVVMLAIKEFGMTDLSSNFSLCEVSVTDNQTIKQKRLQDDLQNLAERIGLSSR